MQKQPSRGALMKRCPPPEKNKKKKKKKKNAANPQENTHTEV